MSEGFWQLPVGAITCTVIHEGNTVIDMSAIGQRYPNATPEEIEDAKSRLSYLKVSNESHMNILMIETAGSTILVDTGMGIGSKPHLGNLIDNLQLAGKTPADIDIVYISHFHIDHINGLLTDGQITYPNARYITGQQEWDYWMSAATQAEIGAERSASLNNLLLPLREKFSFVVEGDAIAEGVTVLNSFGHSPGHTGLKIESHGEQLIHLVDILHHAAQFFYPNWHIRFDSKPEEAAQTRRDLLAKASDENWRVMFFHLPFPGIGHITRMGDSFIWQPDFE